MLVVSFASALAAQAPSIDWEREKAEILTHYRALIQIDTSSPPGNETRVVEYLKKVFEDAGIPTKTFALDPNRANLVDKVELQPKRHCIPKDHRIVVTGILGGLHHDYRLEKLAA